MKNLGSKSSDTKKEIEVKILTRGESAKQLGHDDYFPATGDNRNQKSNQGGLGDVSQEQTGTDKKTTYSNTDSGHSTP